MTRNILSLPAALLFGLLQGCAEKEYVNEMIDITGDYSFSESVTKTKYRVAKAGVVIDGNNHTIDGICNTDCIGLVIHADNVTVKNLTIKRFEAGVNIRPGVSGVKFENVKVLDNVNHGIYVDYEGRNFSCVNCDVSDNGTMGIYLEYDTQNNLIQNSRITNNGYRDKDTGDWVENLKADKKEKREGIAIDASQNNRIENSVFKGNALTGITMYKNCGERGVTRETGANNNVVSNSTVWDGIHIASRQDKDLSEWSCSDQYILDDKYVMDQAEFNRVENVKLKGNATIRIQDDNNTLHAINGGSIIISSTVRRALNLPITGNQTTAVRNSKVEVSL